MEQSFLSRLMKLYGKARISLKFSNPHELLFATMLSAQCTDIKVNQVTDLLFKKYRAIDDFARAKLSELETDIKSTGFYRNKAKNIQNAAQMIVRDFDGEVPEELDQLLKLPGVARKTANVVLGNAFNKTEGIVVDTHVTRVSQRLGLTTNKNPEKIEQDLMKLIPRKNWTWFSHAVIEHGRKICQAKKPKCLECPFRDICPSFKLFT